jgi:tetratricopeptide (TPR) repeat protein
MNTHLWLHGGTRADRRVALDALNLPAPFMSTVDTHRRLRGPYTAAGTISRAITPGLLDTRPDLVRRNDIELLCVAPELRTMVPGSRETLTSLAIPKERTRFYARLRTMRIANGLVEFLRDGLPEDRPHTVVFENVEHADPTDLEFLATLLRRVDAARLTVVVCTSTDHLDLPGLDSRTEAIAVTATAPASRSAEPAMLAWEYVRSECTDDHPELAAAYHALTGEERAELHERRAAELAKLDEQTLRVGAIPFHLEHGTDPTGRGAKALHEAQDYCVCVGFYDATVEYGARCRALVGPAADEEFWWVCTTKSALSLAILGRSEEAEELYDEARLVSVNPRIHMAAAYSTGMLYTRHHDLAKRDERIAKSWCNTAIAIASLQEDPVERAFLTAFNKNGLALVEVNLGDLNEALRLVTECIDGLDRQLEPEEHRPHRSVLKNNRARVYAALGRLDEALADYAVAIGDDPNHAEHYLERAGLYRRLGRVEDAFADYATAMRLSPPFPEVVYNRGDLRASVEDVDGALADFSYVLELDPDFVDAYVNRAGIYLDRGDLDAAERDAEAGLRLDPANPYLHVVLGQIHLEREHFAAARDAFDQAIAADPDLITALSGRATLAYQTGERDLALADLHHAVELQPDDPLLRYNRAFAYQDEGRWDDALADLTVAIGLAPGDPDIQAALETCLAKTAVS